MWRELAYGGRACAVQHLRHRHSEAAAVAWVLGVALAPRRARLVPRRERAAAATVLYAGQHAAELTLLALGQLGNERGAAAWKPHGIDEPGAALLSCGGWGAASE